MFSIQAQAIFGLVNTTLVTSGVLGIGETLEVDQEFNLQVHERYSDFFIARGMRPDVLITNSTTVTGTNFFTRGGRASIGIPKALLTHAPDAFGFLLKRQVGRLVNNHNFTTFAVQTTAGLVARCLGNKYEEDHKYLLYFGAAAIQYTTATLINRYAAHKADEFAIEHSTDAELTGARIMFYAQQAMFRLLHNQDTMNSILFTADGELRIDPENTSIANKIAKIEAAMIAREMGVLVETEDGQAVELPAPTEDMVLAALYGLELAEPPAE